MLIFSRRFPENVKELHKTTNCASRASVFSDHSKPVPFRVLADAVAVEDRKLRSMMSVTTATVDENVTSKYNLLYHKSFAIIQSRSRPTIWAKYPKKKTGTKGFRVKIQF